MKNYKNGQKCLDDCSKYNLFLDINDKKCYDDCKDNINSNKYTYKNLCINLEKIPQNYILDKNNNFISICDPKNEYEFNNKCYNDCPEGTKLDESIKIKNLCICNNLFYLKDKEIKCVNSNVCPDNYPYLKIGTLECSNYSTIYQDEYYTSCPEGTCITQINKNLVTCVEKLDEFKTISNICIEDFSIILDRIEELNDNNNIIINKYEGVTINLYEIGVDINEMKENFKNLTFIDLNECANELREFYNLNFSEKLYILSIDYFNKISNRPTNGYSFEVYLENKTKL